MQEIIVIGAGNLAWHLIAVLQNTGKTVSLASRDPGRVAEWPVRVIALSDIPIEPEMVFIAVPDDAISTVSTELSLQLPPTVPIIHTSGATPLDRINSYFKNRGALWPIRSLLAGDPVGDWHDLPIAYHGSNAALTQVLGKLSSEMSDMAYPLNDDQRARLHLAAVFSNNFVSWLYEISHQLCRENDIPFETLLPIIRNTALSQTTAPPRTRQTGAAARRDFATMERHLTLLNGYPEYARLYREMSGMIMEGLRDRVFDGKDISKDDDFFEKRLDE